MVNASASQPSSHRERNELGYGAVTMQIELLAGNMSARWTKLHWRWADIRVTGAPSATHHSCHVNIGRVAIAQLILISAACPLSRVLLPYNTLDKD